MRRKSLSQILLFCLLVFSGLLFITASVSPSLYVRNTSPHDVPVSERIKDSEAEKTITEGSAESATDYPAAVPYDDTDAESKSNSSSSENTVSAASGYGVPDWGHIHRFRDGICTVCGEAPELLTGFLPAEFYTEADHGGTVYLHEYEIPTYED